MVFGGSCESFFNTMGPPLTLNLFFTPLKCDGCLFWMKACPQRINMKNAQCAEPKHLSGMSVQNVEDPYFLSGVCPGMYV